MPDWRSTYRTALTILALLAVVALLVGTYAAIFHFIVKYW